MKSLTTEELEILNSMYNRLEGFYKDITSKPRNQLIPAHLGTQYNSCIDTIIRITHDNSLDDFKLIPQDYYSSDGGTLNYIDLDPFTFKLGGITHENTRLKSKVETEISSQQPTVIQQIIDQSRGLFNNRKYDLANSNLTSDNRAKKSYLLVRILKYVGDHIIVAFIIGVLIILFGTYLLKVLNLKP